MALKKAPKRYAPAELCQLIDLANSVRPDFEFPPVFEDQEKFLRLVKSRDFSRFRRLTGQVRPDIRLRRFLGKNHPKTFGTVFGNYHLVREARDWLHRVVQLESFPRGVGSGPVGSKVSFLAVRLDERGHIRFSVSAIVQALDEVEGARIRICPLCRLFFWASRKDKPCCGARCANAWRQRLWRARDKALYKQARIKKSGATRLLQDME